MLQGTKRAGFSQVSVAEKRVQKSEQTSWTWFLMHCSCRLGRDDEGEALVDSVLKEENIDESTLHAMTLAYRELDQGKNVFCHSQYSNLTSLTTFGAFLANKICEAYEIATKRYPHNEELVTQLFMALVKQDNFKRQQQVIMS